MYFKDKVAWITGASSGIGESLAFELAKQGAKLILSSRNEKELQRVKNECNIPSENCLILPIDMANIQDIDKITKQAIDKMCRIDFLFNNAGISQRSMAKETHIEIDRKIFEINFFGPVALTKSVLPYMIKQGGGHIIATSSVVGKFGFPFRSAYSSSKHAMQGFFESLRAELMQDNIKVTILIPGRIKTNISINAITKDGKPHGLMDEGQAKGISCEKATRIILNGVRRNKKEILFGGKEIIMVYIRRLLPWLFYRMVSKMKPT